jgi:hypothetical protein
MPYRVIIWVRWAADAEFEKLFAVDTVDGDVELLSGAFPVGVNFVVKPEGVNPNA